MMPRQGWEKSGPTIWELAQSGDSWAQYTVQNLGYTLALGGAVEYPWAYGYNHRSSGRTAKTNEAPPAPHHIFAFDTIGQTIFRTIGHVRVPLRTIWAAGVEESGDASISNTQTFAAALCAPIDPLEDGEIFSLWDGSDLIYQSGQPVAPTGWTDEDSELLTISLDNAVIYPGDESQQPAPLIVADKGASRTNAFRGIRYVILPGYPLRNGSGGLPNLSAGIKRTKDGEEPEQPTGAVEFAPGTT